VLVGFVLRGNWYWRDVRIAEQRGRDALRRDAEIERESHPY
jgi:hypothetical protein